jgi:hypothetical protein
MYGIPQKLSNPRYGVLLGILLAGSIFTAPAGAGEQEVMSGSVAAAIRQAGHPCAHVIQMDRMKEGAAEGFTTWDVRCNSGRFKVEFKGDTGSEVVPLD